MEAIGYLPFLFEKDMKKLTFYTLIKINAAEIKGKDSLLFLNFQDLNQIETPIGNPQKPKFTIDFSKLSQKLDPHATFDQPFITDKKEKKDKPFKEKEKKDQTSTSFNFGSTDSNSFGTFSSGFGSFNQNKSETNESFGNKKVSKTEEDSFSNHKFGESSFGSFKNQDNSSSAFSFGNSTTKTEPISEKSEEKPKRGFLFNVEDSSETKFDSFNFKSSNEVTWNTLLDKKAPQEKKVLKEPTSPQEDKPKKTGFGDFKNLNDQPNQGFGSDKPVFGTQKSDQGLGNQNTSQTFGSFGNSSQNSGFGSGFGNSSKNQGFGSGFGSTNPSITSFGNNTQTGFSGPSQTNDPKILTSSQGTFGTVGSGNNLFVSQFGSSGFGNQNTSQNQTSGSFGNSSQNSQNQGFGSGFGNTSKNQGFGFGFGNSSQNTSQNLNQGFGSTGSFGNNTQNVSGFGNTSQNQGFGSGFGNTSQSQGFGFGFGGTPQNQGFGNSYNSQGFNQPIPNSSTPNFGYGPSYTFGNPQNPQPPGPTFTFGNPQNNPFGDSKPSKNQEKGGFKFIPKWTSEYDKTLLLGYESFQDDYERIGEFFKDKDGNLLFKPEEIKTRIQELLSNTNQNIKFETNSRSRNYVEKDFKKFFNDKYGDATIISKEGKEIRVHKAIVSITSKYLFENLIEKKQDKIKIEHSFETLMILIQYLYTSPILVNQLYFDQVLDLIECSELLKLNELKPNLEKELIKKIDLFTVYKVWKRSIYQTECMEIIERNIQELIKSGIFIHWDKDFIFNDFEKSIFSKLKYNLIISWACKNLIQNEEKREFLKYLIHTDFSKDSHISFISDFIKNNVNSFSDDQVLQILDPIFKNYQ